MLNGYLHKTFFNCGYAVMIKNVLLMECIATSHYDLFLPRGKSLSTAKQQLMNNKELPLPHVNTN